MTFDQAQEALRDPSTSEQMLAEIAYLFPLLHEQIKVHPQVYADLIDWMNQAGSPDVAVSPQPLQPAPMLVDSQFIDPALGLVVAKSPGRNLKWALIPGIALAVLAGSVGAYAVFSDNKPQETEVAAPPSPEPDLAEVPVVEETAETLPDEPVVVEAPKLLEPTPVNEVFPDPALAQCVADVLEAEPTETIVQDDLNRLHSHTLSYQLANKYYFYDPNGGEQSSEMQPGGEELIAYARNGNVFGCTDPSLESITGLEYVPFLTSVDFAGTQVSDLTPLSNQSHLVILDLSETRVADIGPLSALTYLELLYISDGTFKNVDALSGMKDMQDLMILDTDLENLNGLNELTELKSLVVGSSLPLDLSPLRGMEKLEELMLRESGIMDISALSNLISLETLYFFNTQVDELSSLSGLTNLKQIFADDTKISDLTPLSHMTNLQELSVPPGVDTSPLNGLVEQGLELYVWDHSE